ncbi:MAG TPA: hypothetical protein VG271_15180 [Beijerinckiaceae bacterium]|nr:hypothetical protein [Beijerinckiaceae bacterium]
MRPASALHHGDDLRADLAALSERLDDMRRDAVVRDEQQFRTINEKIESLGAQRPDIATLARIRAQTEEIRNLLAAAAARPMPIENIEGQIAALAQRLDSIASLGPSPAALAQVDAQLAEIRAALERPVSEPALQQIENRIESLTQRVEQALSSTPGSGQFDELAQRLDFVHRSLAARMERPVAAVDTVAFEGMMRDIVGKLAQPSPKTSSQPQLEDLLSRLADRLETPEPTARLEGLVRDLADKIDAAAPGADQRAFDSLQEQIARLAQRLDQTDSNAGVLGSLEHKISDLFEGLEQTRQTAIDAAEIAARTAAQDAVREVGLVSSSKSRDSGEEQSEHVTRELADLRSVQAAADRQTHATLTAVHETLEKVVDRLAMLEDEIGEVRKTAVEEPFASGLPPVFAPSRSRGGGSGAGEFEPRLDDRDFLIEPGSGFAPERRASDGPNKPPFPPESKPPAGPSSTPSLPQSGSTQANFIAAARRTIQAKAENSDQASRLRPMGALDGALADARTRARAAAAALMDDPDPREKPEKERGPSALARAGAFFAGRKRPLVLGLAGVVVTLCALELVHNQAAPHIAVIDETATPVPAKPATVGVAQPAPASSSLSETGPATTTGQSGVFGNSAPTDAVPAPSPERTSSAAAPGVDLSPVGAIANKPAAPPILALASVAGSPNSTVASDLPAVRDLAGRGNAAAQFELGVRYAEGRGLPRDLKLAAQWLEKSAQQNNAPAQYRLATLYEKGLGVTHDANVAINWYRRAANAGNIRAMHNLAVMIAENGDGKPDYDDAAIWFRKAAEYGVRDSQYNLAILYARGLGVQKDLSQSYIWFTLAAAQGDSDSTSKRDEIAAHLDAKQLADAKAIIDAFKPQNGSPAANDVDPPPGGWASLIANPALPARAPAKAKVSAL